MTVRGREGIHVRVVLVFIPDVLFLEPKTFADARGFLLESYNRRAFRQATGVDVGAYNSLPSSQNNR